MIRSFGDKGTENLFHGTRSKETLKYPGDVVRVAIRKLDVLNGANELRDLAAPPGNRFKALGGDLKGFQSIRVNNQWRIIFKWEPKGPGDARLTDYH